MEVFYVTYFSLSSISVVFSCSFFVQACLATLHNQNAGYRNIELKKKSIMACYPSEMGVTAFHVHCLSLLWNHIRGIHQITGFVELKLAAVTVTVTQHCSNGGHLATCGHRHTRTHMHTWAFNTNSITLHPQPALSITGRLPWGAMQAKGITACNLSGLQWHNST